MKTQSAVLTPAHPRWSEFVDQLNAAGEAMGCDRTHRHARQVMSGMGNVDIAGSLEYFEERGGYCDCEILLNVESCSEGRKAAMMPEWPKRLSLPQLHAPTAHTHASLSAAMKPKSVIRGRVIQGIRRAFVAYGGRDVTTTELMQ